MQRREATQRSLREQPQFIGYFLDNEPKWHAADVFDMYRGLPKAAPGSRAFLAYLRRYYQGNLDRLNAEWGTSYASFDGIPGSQPPMPYSMTMQEGLLPAWRTEVAVTFYRRYAAMVRTLDPHHLILGIRYRGVPDLGLFTALSPYFDVNSINDYNRYGDLKPVYANLYKATGKPLMITEFSFSGFPEVGHPSGLFVDVYTQERRGVGYYKYVRQAAQAPFMVGMHWFMWMDYPQRATAKDYPYPPDENVGLVSNDETTVYEELGRWIKRTHGAVETLHRAARWAPPSEPAPQRVAVPRFVPTVDGDLTEWPRARALRPTSVRALLDGVHVNHTYFLAWDEQALYLAGDIDDASGQHAPQGHGWESDYFALQVVPEGLSNPRMDSARTLVIYPSGGGSQQQPYAVRWHGPQPDEPLPVQVAKRSRPGGYTLEARIPATAMARFHPVPGTTWRVTLRYQNVEAIYQTQWGGVVTLE